jgi:hypothetical protein
VLKPVLQPTSVNGLVSPIDRDRKPIRKIPAAHVGIERHKHVPKVEVHEFDFAVDSFVHTMRAAYNCRMRILRYHASVGLPL